MVLVSWCTVSLAKDEQLPSQYITLDKDIQVTEFIGKSSLSVKNLAELNPSITIQPTTILLKGTTIIIPSGMKDFSNYANSDMSSFSNGNVQKSDQNSEISALSDSAIQDYFSFDPSSKFTDATNPIVIDLPELGSKSQADPSTKASSSSLSSEKTMAEFATQSAQYDWQQMNEAEIKQRAKNWATDKARAVAENEIIQPVNHLIQDTLSIFGKAEMNISVNNDGDVKLSRFSLLTPFAEQDSGLIFTQLNLTEQDNDMLGHVGLGYRYIKDGWLYGVNTFLDHDFSDYHTRMSIGSELGTDYFKGAANYYFPISSWKDSKDFVDFEERPAHGYDLRLQGYLPNYSQIGASAVFEQYFGDDVALFGRDSYRKNPIAFTLGLDYTPIPLITAKSGYKFGESGDGEARFDLSLNLLIGEDLSSQLDPGHVSVTKKLQFSRYDIVDRNYEMVLQRRAKDELFDLTLGQLPTLLPQTYYALNLSYQNNLHPFSEIVRWEQTGGCANPLLIEGGNGNTSLNNWQVYAPTWQSDTKCNVYHLRAIVSDSAGHQKASNEIIVTVGAPLMNSHLDISTNILPSNGRIALLADGYDSFEMNIKLVDGKGDVLKFDSLQSMIKGLGLKNNEAYIDLLDSNNISRKNDPNVKFEELYQDGVYTLKVSASIIMNQIQLKFNGGVFGNSEFNLSFSEGSVVIENIETSATSATLTYSLLNPRGQKLTNEQHIPVHNWNIFNISGLDIADQLSIVEKMDVNTGFIVANFDLTKLPNAFAVSPLQHLILHTSLKPYGDIEQSVGINNGISYEQVKLSLINLTPINGHDDFAYAGNGQLITVYGQVIDEHDRPISVSAKMRENWQWSIYEVNSAGVPSVNELHGDSRIVILDEHYDEAQNRFEIILKANQFINIELFLSVNDALNSEVLPLRFLRDPSKLRIQLFNTGADGLQVPAIFQTPKIDQFYEAKVFDTTSTNNIDVTAYYTKSLKWYYKDPDDSSIQLIARCSTNHMFSTQVSNTENIDHRSLGTNSEQGLMLSAAFDNELDEPFPQPLVKCPDGKYVF